MDENFRFIAIIDSLKSQGVINDYVQIAKELQTNKAAISDIKSGRKKLSIEMLRRLKSSYPSCNVEWVVTGEGEPFINNKSNQIPSSSDTLVFINKISEQAQEIGRLKAQIEAMERGETLPSVPVYAHLPEKETVET